MKIVGIICEYNPFHLGHQKQIAEIRRIYGEDTAIVCLMSGNFVQRGHPAILDKSLRAAAAVESGANLVLELPVEYALSSAEGFAAGGVKILSPFCTELCFGAETADKKQLLTAAQALLSADFPPLLRQNLDTGLSFPTARQRALETLGLSGELISRPNNILAVEYCKAVLTQGSSMDILPISRQGNYHAEAPDKENPSATALRKLLLRAESAEDYIPEEAYSWQQKGALHSLEAGERAMLGKLRAMKEAEFEALPYGSEGLWRKLMHGVHKFATLEEILTFAKSKRYTRSRLDRMVLCAYLGLTDLASPPPYVRVLAMDRKGGQILNMARETGEFINAGEAVPGPYWEQEKRIGDLYGLFALDAPDAPGLEIRRRILYFPE